MPPVCRHVKRCAAALRVNNVWMIASLLKCRKHALQVTLTSCVEKLEPPLPLHPGALQAEQESERGPQASLQGAAGVATLAASRMPACRPNQEYQT